MKNLSILTLLLIGTLFITSCSKDKEPPVISVSTPSNGADYKPGEELDFEATFTDDEELSQYKIDIHPAGDHGHKTAGSEWEYEMVYDISSAQHSAHEHFDIPNDAEEGEYHLTVSCTDLEGNEAELVVIEFHIEP